VRVFVIAIVGTHAFFLWSVRERIVRADPDFTSFYGAGKILRDGHGADLYDLGTQHKAQDEFSSNADIRKGPLPYIHPPYEALLFVPLTFLHHMGGPEPAVPMRSLLAVTEGSHFLP
jgi:hypothetical protein